MSPHPPIRARPTALWKGVPPPDSPDPEVLPYRPDWFALLGAPALDDPGMRALAFRHPACALALLTADYERTHPLLEPALVGCGEAVYHYLGWRESQGLPRELRPDFRQTLVHDGYWGFRHARRTGDTGLLADIEAWCGDERRRHGAAAALHLMRHPREPVAPYRDVIASHPFYAYLALPRLFPRAFTIEPEDAAGNAKWSWHFGLSRFSGPAERYMPAILTDPGWAVEHAVATGGLEAGGRRRLLAILRERAQHHPLLPAATGFLAEPAVVPTCLASGHTAETRTLDALGRSKNKELWRPSAEQIGSEAFRRIVGPPRFTERGYPRGTVVDAADAGLAEIKSGRSLLAPSYQLRLQAFRAHVERRPLKIYTSRPAAPQFTRWLGPLGVTVEPLPEP